MDEAGSGHLGTTRTQAGDWRVGGLADPVAGWLPAAARVDPVDPSAVALARVLSDRLP